MVKQAYKRTIIMTLILTIISINLSIAINNNNNDDDDKSNISTSSSINERDQIASPSEEDTKSVHQDKNSSSLSVTKPQQRTGSVQQSTEQQSRSTSSSNGNDQSTNPQRLLQLLQSTEPGQFVPLTNQEVSEGHVTMIGYTTPIVKVGEPIPIEQYLREQRQIREKHEQQQQQQTSTGLLSSVSPSSQAEFAKFLATLSKQINSATDSSNSAQESNDIPLRLVLPPQNPLDSLSASQQPLLTLNDVRGSSLTHPNIDPKLNSLVVEEATPGFQSSIPDFLIKGAAQLDAQFPSSGSLSSSSPSSSLQLSQSPVSVQQQQFVQPLEKPRPFVVMKPGFRSNPKLLHQIQIEHNQQQPAVSSSPPSLPSSSSSSSSTTTTETENPFLRFSTPFINNPSLLAVPNPAVQIQAQSHLGTAHPSLFQHFSAQLPVGQPAFRPIQAVSHVAPTQSIVSPQTHHHLQSSSPLIRNPFHTSSLVSPTSSLLGTSSIAVQPPSQQPSLPPTSSILQHPSTSPFLTTSNAATSVSHNNHNVNNPSSFHIAKKQVQVETVEGPPSSTVDTKAELQNQIRHILASSPNLSEDSRAKHREAIFKAVHSLVEPAEPSSATRSHHSHSHSHPSSSVRSNNRFPTLEPFHHPKSMLFNFPVSSSSPVTPQTTASNSPINTPSTLAVLGGANTGSSQIHRPEQFTSLSSLQPAGKLLTRFPSMLPGFQTLSSSAEHANGKQHEQQLQNDHRIQKQIHTFLQQHDPQRLHLTHLTHSSPSFSPPSASLQQQPALSQEFSGGSFIVNTPILSSQPNQQAQQQTTNSATGKIRLAPGLVLSADEPSSSGQRQFHTQQGGITISRGQPVQLPADRITVANNNNNNENSGVRFHAAGIHHQAQASHHHHIHHNHHNPFISNQTSFQSEASTITPKANSREFSEWWKERAFTSSELASIKMLTNLAA